MPFLSLPFDGTREVIAAALSFAGTNVPDHAIDYQPISASIAVYVALAGPSLPDTGEIIRSADGFFYVDAQVNGAPVRFLVDTGASTVVLSKEDARRAGIAIAPDEFNEQAGTAAGRTPMARTVLAHVSTGWDERRNVDAAIAGGELQVSLLGQSWLAQINSVTITRDRMVFR